MQRERLTLARIETLTCTTGKKQSFLWDTEAPRLAVRVTSSGAKSFVFEGKLERQTIRKTIGDVRNWKLADAREEARRLQTLIDTNVDPRELEQEAAEKKAAAKAAKEAEQQAAIAAEKFTLGALCNAYVSLLEAQGKTSARQARSTLKVHLHEAAPATAALPANKVTAHDIAALVRSCAEKGKDRAAGILRSYLLAAYNAARKAPFDAKLPSSLIAFNVEVNPVEPISTIAVQRGERTLSADELKQYIGALSDTLTDMALSVAVFAGGQRMAQLLRAKVGDWDAESQVLRLWDGKGRRAKAREHLLPLAPKAAAFVERLIVRAVDTERAIAKQEGREPAPPATLWLFSAYGRQPMVDTAPGKRAKQIASAMKGEPFDLRDVRRTCETMMARMGISKDIRAQVLSHGLSGVQVAHYDRHDYLDEKRAALVAWEKHLDGICTGKGGKNVVPMKKRTG